VTWKCGASVNLERREVNAPLDFLSTTRFLVTRFLWVLIPGVGFLLAKLFPLTPDATVGILLLAAIEGTPIALQFTRMAKTRLAFAAVMTFVLSVMSIALTPVAVEVMPQAAPHREKKTADTELNR